MRNLALALSLSLSFLSSSLFSQVRAGLPDFKIYGVNLGSWLVLEAWMLPQEWVNMGGQICANCLDCIATESAFAKAYPVTVDERFAHHWDTWFTQDHVHKFSAYGINTVRVPLGYWIIESLVNRAAGEAFPRGGLTYLRRGLGWLKAAGIQAILDHHALPGVQTPGQQFTGNCTNDVQFYTPYNYHRALIWTAVMTSLAHLDPNFGSVFAIEAVNEPIMNAALTPDYGEFQKNFVHTVRFVEFTLGIWSPGLSWDVTTSTNNFTEALSDACSTPAFNAQVTAAVKDAIPIMLDIAHEFGLEGIFTSSPFRSSRSSLVTTFMDVNWQNNNPANPAKAADGPQGYDNHLYYSFGGVADPNPDAYLTSVCNLQRIQNDAAVGDSPLWFGEWGLPTQFNATNEFLYKWADAQKWAYSKGAGWIFWNFKTEISSRTNGTSLARQWSYLQGVEMGFLTQNPASYNDPDVCAPYINGTHSNTS